MRSSSGLQHDGDLQDVLIIGGGIAGLATALALHRIGLKPMVLESSPELSTGGAAIAVWQNAWKALDVLGVASGLGEKFQRIKGAELCSAEGEVLARVDLDNSQSIELRPVKRTDLLEALREPLLDGSVVYGSKVSNIRTLKGGYTEVECENGLKIQTKVLVGCDGVKSAVGKWLGLKKPTYAGYTAILGIATFPVEHGLRPISKQIVGRGVRVGIIPMDAKRVFWFQMFNTEGHRITDPQLIREEALLHVRGWSHPIIEEVIKNSPLETLIRRDIGDRWTWPGWTSPPLYKGGVTVAGDAMHPMTPNMAQGGCCALEDAVVLARHLGCAFRRSFEQGLERESEIQLIENALKAYTEERWPRTLSITIRAYIIGVVMQMQNGVLCSIRNTLTSKLGNFGFFTGVTSYDCGNLETVKMKNEIKSNSSDCI